MKNEKKPHVIWKMFGRKSNTLLLMALGELSSTRPDPDPEMDTGRYV